MGQGRGREIDWIKKKRIGSENSNNHNNDNDDDNNKNFGSNSSSETDHLIVPSGWVGFGSSTQCIWRRRVRDFGIFVQSEASVEEQRERETRIEGSKFAVQSCGQISSKRIRCLTSCPDEQFVSVCSCLSLCICVCS